MRWFLKHQDTDVMIENISDRLTGFQIAGPKATEVLQACTLQDVSQMRFMDVARMTVGMVDCHVQRVSYTGDLGYEIYCDLPSQRALWQALWQAGQPHAMLPFGMRAMMSLRLDKFFGSWMREYSPDYTAAETGLDRFISFNKPDNFIGRAAAEAQRTTGAARKLCAFEVDATDADIVAYEPISIKGEVVGFCTSGGFSHHAQKSIALGFVPTPDAQSGLEVEIEILGEMHKARLITDPLFDAEGTRMRG